MGNLKHDLRAAERELETMGFGLVREGAHRIFRDAAGRTVVVPKPHASGDWRAMKNLTAQIRRLKKEETK
jgi:predicted RNA binding protein YcfA (HicA-like mRNA interferase family)